MIAAHRIKAMLEKNLPFDEYFKRPGVNGSILKVVDEFSLKRARAVLDGKLVIESDTLDFGTCFHSLLLEGRIDYEIQPDTYENEKGEVKPWNWNANVCKSWGAAQGDRIILTKKEAESVEAMVAAVHDQPEIQPFLKGDRELSAFAERDGVPVKSRIDLLSHGPVIDFKKTLCAEPGKFLKQAIEKRYHMGAAWNLDVLRWAGIERKEFWLVGVEAKPPFDVTILKMRDEALSFLRVGRQRCRAAFQRLKNANAENHWPSYGIHDAEDFAKPWHREELETTA